MKLSAICILGTLGLLSLVVCSRSQWFNDYNGEGRLTPYVYKATGSFYGCHGRAKGEEYAYRGRCNSCTCLGDKTTCRRCERLKVPYASGWTYSVRANLTLSFPDCCPYIYAEDLGVFVNCEGMEYEGRAGTPWYKARCFLYINKDCEDLVKQGKRDSQQYKESCSDFQKRGCENLEKQGNTDSVYYWPYCWVYKIMECENMAKQGKTDSEYYAQNCQVVKNEKCDHLAHLGRKDAQYYIQNCWVAYNRK